MHSSAAERLAPQEEEADHQVPKEVFLANIRGNEKLPQNYFAVCAEVFAEILTSPNPREILDEYLNSSLSAKQVETLATAGTNFHAKYGIVNSEGEAVPVTEALAEKLWMEERRRALSFVYQVSKMACNETPGSGVSPLELAFSPENYARTASNFQELLDAHPELRAELVSIFKAFQNVIESQEMRNFYEVYKAAIANRRAIEATPVDPLTGERPMNYVDHGKMVRSEIMRRAERLLTFTNGPYGPPTLLRAKLIGMMHLCLPLFDL